VGKSDSRELSADISDFSKMRAEWPCHAEWVVIPR
jgi:hypothetical protein